METVLFTRIDENTVRITNNSNKSMRLMLPLKKGVTTKTPRCDIKQIVSISDKYLLNNRLDYSEVVAQQTATAFGFVNFKTLTKENVS